ncbi:MAG: aldo/keto reductase, partial [Nonomuraea sp.]|nr:aldo/keto reductase [Nonomuraea sp.]
MINRWIEDGLLDVLEEAGMGCIVFSPLAQGLLTDRYLEGVPSDSRAATSRFLSADRIDRDLARDLNEIASGRGQSLAQMALSWTLRDPRVTSVLIGASSVRQLEDNVACVDGPAFTEDELDAIDAVTKLRAAGGR